MKKYDLLFPFGQFRLPAVAGRCIAELGGRQDFRYEGKRLAEQKGRFFLSYRQRLKSRLNPGLSRVERALEGFSTPYQACFGPRTALWIAPGVITAEKSLSATLRYEGVAQMAVFFLHTVTLITLQSWSHHCGQLWRV